MKKLALLLVVIIVLSGCASNPSVSSLSSLERQRVANMAVLNSDDIPKESYQILGTVEGIACKRNLYASGSPSMAEAQQGVLIRAAQMGADAIINMVCEDKQEVDLGRNCWQTVVCVADAIKITTSNYYSKAPDKAEKTEQSESTGTAFLINNNGYLITNYHVINGCRSIKVNNNLIGTDAKVLFVDEINDLAIIKASIYASTFASFRGGKSIRVGEDIITLGYPLGPILGETVKVTKGIMSSSTGLANDTSIMQITAPIQPGNSGGPVLDTSGNVVAVVSSKLNEIAMAQATGSLPQNVNFAIKSQTVGLFLDTHGIDYESKESVVKSETVDIAQGADDYTVRVTCTH